MNISKKEKLWLSILGIVAIGFIYYQFVFLYLEKTVENKEAQEREIETKYNNAKDEIEKMDSKRSKVKILNAKISDEAKGVYPTVSQEHIILEIDKLLKDNGLEGGMEFDAVELDAVDVIKKSDKDKGNLKSTIQATADKYNNSYGKSKDEKNSDDLESNTKEENQTNDKAKSNEKSNTSNSTKKDDKKSNPNKVIKMKGKVKFYGTYQNVVKFVKSIGEREKNKICLYGIGMDINDISWVKGEVGIGIYSVPKIDDTISDYLNWTLNNTYGKSEPFQLNQSAGNGIKAEVPTSDFMISVKSSSSDLPTIMIGKAYDTLRSTYVYSDANDKHEAEIVLTKQGDKYYYKYKTGNTSMPVDYSGVGNEFIPNGDNIDISISSESKISDSDKSGLKLDIVNNTNKLVKVDISNDDKNNPRVSIGGDNKNISVSQK